MSINPISSSITNLLSLEPVITQERAADKINSGSFADVFTESFQTAVETDHQDKFSALELLSGQSDDMSGLLLDVQKAEISLNLALQLRNKVIEAYQEIMRMQV